MGMTRDQRTHPADRALGALRFVAAGLVVAMVAVLLSLAPRALQRVAVDITPAASDAAGGAWGRP